MSTSGKILKSTVLERSEIILAKIRRDRATEINQRLDSYTIQCNALNNVYNKKWWRINRRSDFKLDGEKIQEFTGKIPENYRKILREMDVHYSGLHYFGITMNVLSPIDWWDETEKRIHELITLCKNAHGDLIDLSTKDFRLLFP